MRILESLKEVTESTSFDGAISAIKRIMDEYGEINHINTEIINLDEINQLARLEIDNDETYGWSKLTYVDPETNKSATIYMRNSVVSTTKPVFESEQ